jgi:hypothetical protein
LKKDGFNNNNKKPNSIIRMYSIFSFAFPNIKDKI